MLPIKRTPHISPHGPSEEQSRVVESTPRPEAATLPLSADQRRHGCWICSIFHRLQSVLHHTGHVRKTIDHQLCIGNSHYTSDKPS
jgi:hypothetical protein